MIYNNSSVIHLNKKAIANNIDFIQHTIGENVTLSAVVKANAYGHGIAQMVPELEKNGVRHFSVFSSSEAREVKIACKKGSTIMIMGNICNVDLNWVVEEGIECFVYNFQMLSTLIDQAKELKMKVRLHFELETGMNRHGFREHEWEKLSEIIKLNTDHISVAGLNTHFAGAESSANFKRVQSQQNVFLEGLSFFRTKNIIPLNVHSSCSAATLTYPEFNHDMVRVGIMLYGLWPSVETKLTYNIKNNTQTSPIQPVLSWKSYILDISHVKSGEFINYGNSFLAEKDMKVASVPVGYGYGFTRSLSNKGRVIVNGKRLSVIGVVNMNMFLIDATNIDLSIGDEVVLIGQSGKQNIKVADFGDLSKQLNYELLTRLDKNIPRILQD
jgi:alanine racemase